ncbi:GGDEF domain-containing protein [Shewanella surugensis]
MIRSFAAMKKQMDGLHTEIAIYKQGLFEQQKFNLIDPLTQLPNRAALEERMSLEFRHYQRHKQALWVIIADIDHFKSINDNFGHSTGDKTLQVISMAFKNALNGSEFVARFGGEEFVLLIPQLSVNHLDVLLNRLRKKIKNIPFKFKNQQITVTVSIGAAKILENETIQDTFERADAALYRAKKESRDKVIIDLQTIATSI